MYASRFAARRWTSSAPVRGALCHNAAAAPAPRLCQPMHAAAIHTAALRSHRIVSVCSERSAAVPAQFPRRFFATAATDAASAPLPRSTDGGGKSHHSGGSGHQSDSGRSDHNEQHGSRSSSSSGGGARFAPSSAGTLLALLGGSGVAAYLWSQARMAGEGSFAPIALPPQPLINNAPASDVLRYDPLAEHKLPALIKEHRYLPWYRRLWFYLRLLCRGTLLASLWLPLLSMGLVLPRHLWMDLVVRALERCGAVFIKLGQWAATRPDLFSEQVCEQMTKLQARVRPHKFKKSVQACHENFGRDMRAPDGSRLLIEEEVLGSGSMGQVHRGFVLSPDGGTKHEVAIKVLHPGIHSRVNLDLTLLYFVAAAVTKIPASELQWLSIPEMLIQFTEFMSSHLDLVQEAGNMDTFRKHFANSPSIRFPTPMYPFVGPQVLVQELVHGIPLGEFLHSESFAAKNAQENRVLRERNGDIMKQRRKQEVAEQQAGNSNGAVTVPPPPPSSLPPPSPVHHEIARLGLRMYLKMLIEDNYVHSDLHPGNLMVSFEAQGPSGGEGQPTEQFEGMSKTELKSEHLKIVVLDSGLVSVLTPANRKNFLSLFGALILRDGRLAARLMLDNAPRASCADPLQLQEDMHVIVSRIPLENLASVDLGKLLSEVMNTVRQHHVKLESDFASLIISLAIIEGIGRQLDPNLSLFHEAVPVMLKNRECRRILIDTAGIKACAKLGLNILREEMHLVKHHPADAEAAATAATQRR